MFHIRVVLNAGCDRPDILFPAKYFGTLFGGMGWWCQCALLRCLFRL